MPSNFDITPGFERVYVALSTALAADSGVWRCDGPLAPRELGMVNQQVRTIAYSGDVSNGTLFAGVRVGAGIPTQVWSTAQMTTNLPTWYPSFKPPTGLLAIAAGNGGAFVRVSPNFAADKTVYCGTSSAANAESAFSISNDAGTTFYQKALINSIAADTVVKIDAIQLSPDGATLFVATDDGRSAEPVGDRHRAIAIQLEANLLLYRPYMACSPSTRLPGRILLKFTSPKPHCG